ncbi:MAG: ACP S-malonyltransferase [bacterium]
MFSGQGSHFFQMGKELLDHQPFFRKWMRTLDDIAGKIIGESILNKIYDENKRKSDVFNRTLYTHPAIFMVECALAHTLVENGIKPDYVLGASMGEFASAAISGIASPEELLESVITQAQILESYGKSGGMLAILSDISLYDEISRIFEDIELASINFHSHFVVSGTHSALHAIEKYLKERNIPYQVLPVSQAFHSSLLDPAALAYADFMRERVFSPPHIPFISCSRACILNDHESDNCKSNDFWRDYFWEVVRKPIEFQKTIENLEKKENYIYIDLGPSGTLATFIKYIIRNNSQSQGVAIVTPFGQDLKNLENVTRYVTPVHSTQSSMRAKKMNAFVFPGQGSQKKGMGSELFDLFPELTRKADTILGYSIKELCVEDSQNLLNNTQYTQPALFVVNALMYTKEINDTGEVPSYVAGHSLGEYNALFAAGAFDFETGLKIVKKRGELMSKAHGGGMAAIIGLTEEKIKHVLKEKGLSAIDVANFNSPAQIVISGLCDDIAGAADIFKEAGAKLYIPLKVSGAFHSRYMSAAREKFEHFLHSFEFSKLSIPVISNVEARPYERKKIRQLLADQITHSVKWTESIQYLMGKGIQEFKEIGPGTVLTNLVAKIKKEAPPLIITEESSPEEEKEALSGKITASSLGSKEFKKDYHIKYAYVAGAMYKGIASKELVVKMGKAGLMAYLGTGGLSLDAIEESIQYIQKELDHGEAYGVNLLCNLQNPKLEDQTVDLLLTFGVKDIEAAAFMQMTPSLVRYRLEGIHRNAKGEVVAPNRIMAKVSRPEIADIFMSPPPESIVQKLISAGKLAAEHAEYAKEIPMAEYICVEADSGGHTDQGVAYALVPAMMVLRDEKMKMYGYRKKIGVGAAGGIGTPEAAAASFVMGVDFILTGSINQCTVEAGTSDAVKDMLQDINVQDTTYAPAGDMFEIGAKIQVLRKGVFFPARANKLYDLYSHYNSLDEIDEKTKKQIQDKYFKRSFDEIWEETKAYWSEMDPAEIAKAERSPKHKMALVFRWYFGRSTWLALTGSEEQKVDYQVQCGPSLGAFNQWIRGTGLESWRNRHVDEIAEKLMNETASLLNERFKMLTGTP